MDGADEQRPDAPACNAVPRALQALRRRFPGASARYLELDASALGITRIYLGLLLLTDLARRAPTLSVWYTNAGPLPNHVLLWRPPSEYQFSLFHLASHRGEAIVLFAACGLVFALFTIGYRTRLMHVLSFVAICSLHNRLILFEDGAEVTTRLLAFWTLFLPMGARYSVDALQARLATSAEPERRPAVSLAVPAILLQVVLIYVFNVLHKDGETWREGSAVHYALHQDRIVTWLGWKLRPHLTLEWSRVLSYTAIAVEALLPLLVLSPFATKLTRRSAFVLATGLHLGFAALLNLALFSFNMIGFFLLLLSVDDLRWLSRLPAPLRALSARAFAFTARALAAFGKLAPASFPTPLMRRMAGWTAAAREAVVVLFAVALGSQMLVENPAVPDALRVTDQPHLLRLLVEYPRLYEGWSMFAPNPPMNDAYLYVEAVTEDGRHVDPINELASRIAPVPIDRIPEFLDQNDSWCDFTMKIEGYPHYHHALVAFIRAYPERTGRKQDRLKSFKVWMLEDESPKPGSSQPRNTTRRLILERRKA